MSVWYEGCNEVECTIDDVQRSLQDLGDHYVGVVGLMPGMSSVELVEQGSGSVTIRTNEGLMERTNISTRSDTDSVTVEFDETYRAGSRVTTNAHFVDEFTTSGTGVKHCTVISDLEASGILGFFYRHFARRSMGKAFLNSYKTYLERPAE